MYIQPNKGLTALFVVATISSITNAFVSLENHVKIDPMVPAFDRRQSLASRLGYSRNNVNENRKENRFETPEPMEPSSSNQKDFTLNNESVLMNEIPSSRIGFESKSPESENALDVDAQTIFAENASLLTPDDEIIETRFNPHVDDNIIPTIDTTKDSYINEDLKAVLAASGEAAAAAEASMSPELVEALDELAIEAFNTTTLVTRTEDDTDASPPEVVPTIATISHPIIPSDQQEEQEPNQATLSTVEELLISPDSLDTNLVESSKNSIEKKAMSISTPSVGKILKFAIPAIGVWLCGPILSLIDTSAVGVLSGTTQQAALNPAVAVTDYAALLIAFLYTGTTNMIASSQDSDGETSDMTRTAKMMTGAMRMSTYVGAGLGAFLFAFARPLLRGIIGNDSISPVVFVAAMKYVRIRALGMPAAAILGSTQAACLGMKDIRSPLYVLGVAAIINLIGDIFFVGHSNPYIGGTAGAAWATVLSQYVAVLLFVRWLCNNNLQKKSSEKPPEIMNLSDAILEMTSKPDMDNNNGKSRRQSFRNALESFKLNGRRPRIMPSNQLRDKASFQNDRSCRFNNSLRRKSGNTVRHRMSAKPNSFSINPTHDDLFSTRGFLKDRFSISSLFKLPDAETRKRFAPYILPVTTTQVGRVSGYVAMAHVVASSLGTVSMAAQQVIVSIFYCLCPIADSLSLTAQSFVPAIFDKEPSMEKAAAMKIVLANFLKAGAVFGGAMMAAVCGIPLLTRFFTADKAVIDLVNSIVPLLLIFFGVHGFVCASEGMLLGQKDLGYLGKMYATFFAAVPYMMLEIKKKALAGSNSVDLSAVWTAFIVYQLVRCGFWLSRSAILLKRTNAEAKDSDSNDVLAS